MKQFQLNPNFKIRDFNDAYIREWFSLVLSGHLSVVMRAEMWKALIECWIKEGMLIEVDK